MAQPRPYKLSPEWMICSTCGEDVIPVEGVTALFQRGYWWHARCATVEFVNGEPTVQYPSNGMLLPKTIIHEETT